MTVHISRDFSVAINETGNVDSYIVYLLALFMRRVLLYTVVGHTGLDLDGASLTVASGTGADINQATGFEWWVDIPLGEHVLTAASEGRVLALRSTTNPRHNSGLFRIWDVDTINNRVRIDYRTSEFPPAETGLPWSIHPRESALTYLNGANGLSGQYQTRTTATATRIILQSPDASGYQVRITKESTDSQGDIGGVATTVAPGFGGDASGDFQPSGEHLHNQLWHNNNSLDYIGTTVGMGLSDFDTGSRLYFWGDDSTGSCVVIGRRAGNSATGWCLFGLPENEPSPAPDLDVQRLFAIGDSNATQILPDWTGGPEDANANHGGVAYGLSLRPVSCLMSTMTPLRIAQSSAFAAHRNNSLATDNPMTGRTELQTVDLIAGSWDNMRQGSAGPGSLIFDSRHLGTVPMARLGRSNFGLWSTSTDSSRSWFHAQNGIWLPYAGPKILP
jgi:hypothetical protein